MDLYDTIIVGGGPAVIDEVSHEFNVPKNRILIGSIHDYHQFDYAELGGVGISF